jgi:hypothetical protein
MRQKAPCRSFWPELLTRRTRSADPPLRPLSAQNVRLPRPGSSGIGIVASVGAFCPFLGLPPLCVCHRDSDGYLCGVLFFLRVILSLDRFVVVLIAVLMGRR